MHSFMADEEDGVGFDAVEDDNNVELARQPFGSIKGVSV